MSVPAAQIESVEQAAGLTLITGWVRLPPGAAPPVLRLDAEGAPTREVPLRRLVERPELGGDDLAQGFQLGLRDLPPGMRATLSAEGAVLLGPVALAPAHLPPRGGLTAIGAQGIAGWVLDPSGAAPLLVVEGRFRLPLSLTEPRPDLPIDFGPFDLAEAAPLLGFRLTPAALGEALRGLDPALALLDGTPRSVALVVGGMELGRGMLRVERTLQGKLERVGPGELRGWAADAEGENVADPPAVEVTIEGTRWLTLPAATARDDLLRVGIGTTIRGGGLRAELPWRNPSDVAEPSVALRPAQGRAELRGSVKLEGLSPWRPAREALGDVPPQPEWPRLSIIIPVYNAAEDLARCLDAVLRHSTGPTRLILVDDASPDPAIATLLAGLEGRAGVEVHRNAGNLGFSATVNRGMALAAPDDVVLLNSDTIVGPGWLDGLRLAAQSSRRIGTVTAISNNAGAFSVPEFNTENTPPAWFEAADLARLARQAAMGLWPRVPTGNGFCLLIRRACLDAVGEFDAAAFPRGYGEENDFCQRASRAGFTHVVDDRTLVWHRRGASFLDERAPQMRAGAEVLAARYPEYRTLVGAFRDDAALLAVRWRMRRAQEGAQAALATPKPRVLFVLSSRSGGTPQTNRDLMAALADRYEAWTLHSDGQMVELTRHGDDAALQRHRLSRPILPGDHRSDEYDRHLRELLLRLGFELVHVRHVAWHSLGLIEACRALGIPVVFSFHDFYAVCPTIKLIDAEGRFCGGRCTQAVPGGTEGGEADCVPELWSPSTMPPLRDRFVHRWRAMLGEVLQGCDAFVTTSPYAAALLAEHFPWLAARDLRVIAHGRDFPGLGALAAEPQLGETLRVLVPGNVSAVKGGNLIATLAALDTERDIEFHVLGAVDGALREPMPGVVLHGRYDRDSFAERVAKIRPHLGAILSIWPETYCHTLTECWSVGLPVLGTALGAVEERIGATGAGWLVDRDTPPEEILALLQRLKRDGAEMRARRERVQAWQVQEGRHYHTGAMAARYDALYRDIAARRRSFPWVAAPRPTPVVVVLRAAEASSAFRLALPLRNDTARVPVYRQGSPATPIGEGAAGQADLVLIPAGVLPPRDIAQVLARCAAAQIPLLVEVDAALARRARPGGDAPALAAALASGAATALAASEEAAQLLAEAGIRAETLPLALDAASWTAPLAESMPPPPEGTLRVLGFDDEPAWPALRAALETLAVLGVVEIMPLGPAPRAAAAEAHLRARAAGCGVAVLAGVQGGAERRLALAAAGLPLMRTVGPGEAPGETPQGEVLVADTPDGWVQAIGALSVDPARRTALARRIAAQAPIDFSRKREAALDALVLRLIGRD